MTAQAIRSTLLGSQRFTQHYGARIWIVALALFAAVFLIQSRQSFAQAIDTLAGSSPLWISVIVAAQVGALVIAAATYQALLRHAGYSLCLLKLVAIHLERKVVGTIVPAGGPASVYVFVRDAGRAGVLAGDALFTVGVRGLLGYTSFVSLLLPALFLVRPDGLLLACAIALIIGFILLLGLVLLLPRHQQTLNRIERKLPECIAAMSRQIRNHQTHPGDLAVPYLLALLGQVTNVLTLVAALYALGYTPSVVAVLAGYTVGTTAVTLTPAFQGIGIVEVSMAVTLQQFGVPPGVAIGATLLYRTATVWFPLILGALRHAGRSLSLLSWPEAWPAQRIIFSLPDGFLRKAITTPLILLVMMVTLSGPETTHAPGRAGELPIHESRVPPTAH